MSAQHTPGPWFVWKERAMQEEGLEACEINEELLEFDYFEVMSGTPIGEVSRGRIKGCKMVVELDADDFGEDAEEGRTVALSNARLIAAAPDLLEALEDLLECPYHIDEATVSKAGMEATMNANPRQVVGNMSVALLLVRKARAAIAKATGQKGGA